MSHENIEVLMARLRDARQRISVGSQYWHSKTGGFYRVINLGLDEKTEKPMVIYESIENHLIWIRNVEEWDEEVLVDRWGNGLLLNQKLLPRFIRVESTEEPVIWDSPDLVRCK